MASEYCLIFSAERRKTITLRKDEWTAITSGKFMVIFCTTSTSHPQIRRLCSHPICYRWCWANIQFSMNATCGCRQPLRSQTKTHYHKKLTLISEVSVLCFDTAATECSLMCCFVMHCSKQLPIKQWTLFWSLNSVSYNVRPTTKLFGFNSWMKFSFRHWGGEAVSVLALFVFKCAQKHLSVFFSTDSLHQQLHVGCTVKHRCINITCWWVHTV